VDRRAIDQNYSHKPAKIKYCSEPNPSYASAFMTHTIAVSEEKRSAKDQPSYRMIQSIDAEALIKQAAEYFWLGEAELTRKRGRHSQERALVMELCIATAGLRSRWFTLSQTA
jgi:hypothetical protein